MTAEERELLLRYVRQTAESLLARSPVMPEAPPFLRQLRHSGAFVTFHRGPELRGCMGRLRADGPLAELLEDIVDSSLHDPRFIHDPIVPAELPVLDIEVSVLAPMRVVEDWRQIVPGRHGVVITRGHSSGCFLPQVAAERGWSAETLLTECCRLKAGLPADAWRQPGTRLEIFEAEVVREPVQKAPGGQESTDA